jgi:hypothetical protein
MKTLCIAGMLLLGIPLMAQQLNLANQKKFKVYKASFNPDTLRQGIHGLNARFSCEYSFSDPEYAELTDKDKKTWFVYYLQLFDANNDPVYHPFDYLQFTRALSTTAIHFSAENAYAPQVKSQGRRNTGIELFLPFAHLDLPEGTHELILTVNAYSPKTGKRYEHFHVEKIRLVKPPLYWVQFIPSQMAVFKHNGQRIAVRQLEQDMSFIRGSNLRYPDIAGSANVRLGEPVSFLLSDGDITYLRLHQNKANTGKLADLRVAALIDKGGNPISGFDNPPQGDFLLNLSQKGITLLNTNIEMAVQAEKLRLPPLKLSYPKIKPYLVRKEMTGMSLSIEYDAQLPAGLPLLRLLPAYSASEESTPKPFPVGEVIQGEARMDSTGAIVLPSGKGTVEVFYPFASLQVSQPDIALKTPRFTHLRALLEHNVTPLTYKISRQGFQVTVIRNASLETVVWARDTTYQDEHGLLIGMPAKIPAPYFKLVNGEFSVKLIPTAADDKGKFVNLLKRAIPLNKQFQRLYLDTNNVRSISYKLLSPNPVLEFFLPYTALGQQMKEGLPFQAQFLVNQKSMAKPIELGGNESVLNFRYDPKKLRLLTIGLSKIEYKKAENATLHWRIRSEKQTLYQSPAILVQNSKEITNFYSQYVAIHEADRVYIEVIKGEEAIVEWEVGVSQLQGEKTLVLEAVKSKELKDPGLKRVEIKYIVN